MAERIASRANGPKASGGAPMAVSELNGLKGYASGCASLVDQFARIDGLTRLIGENKHPGLILCGSPGWGKTHRVKSVLKKLGIAPVETPVSNEHVFADTLLYNANAEVFLIDDSDALAGRQTCINICKTAFGPDKFLSWPRKEKGQLIIWSQRIKGRLIWISNRDYSDESTRREELQAHWAALESRGIRPIWLDTSDKVDAFNYIVWLATTGGMLHRMKNPLGKIKSEKIVELFIEHRDFWKELSPRLIADRIVPAFRLDTPEDIQRELREELAAMPVRDLSPILVPKIVGDGRWANAPEWSKEDGWR